MEWRENAALRRSTRTNGRDETMCSFQERLPLLQQRHEIAQRKLPAKGEMRYSFKPSAELDASCANNF